MNLNEKNCSKNAQINSILAKYKKDNISQPRKVYPKVKPDSTGLET